MLNEESIQDPNHAKIVKELKVELEHLRTQLGGGPSIVRHRIIQ